MNTLESLLDVEAITQNLNTRALAIRIIYHERIGSTNDAARHFADEGAPEGTVVIADEQTTGRGRLGRTWLAPPGSSILMSVVLRPPLRPDQLTRLTMAASLAARDAIRSETGLRTAVKWPNDILVNGRKCAGLLAEANTIGDKLVYVILGVGINVNFAAASVRGIPATATTLADEFGRALPRIPLIRTFLLSLDRYYDRLKAGESLHDDWARALSNLHKQVVVQSPWGEEQGLAASVDEDGALILRRADGTTVRLLAGDVTLSPH